MSLKNVEYNFQTDMIKLENEFIATKYDWTILSDNNKSNYTNGEIRFDSASLQGSDVNNYYDFSQSILAIPYTVSLTISGGTFAYSQTTAGARPVVENRYAVSLKGSQHAIRDCYFKVADKVLGYKSAPHNLVMNERLKTLASDKYRMLGDLMGYRLDDSDTYQFDGSTPSELNNIALDIRIVDYSASDIYDNLLKNQALHDRCMRYAIPYDTNRPNSNILFNSTTFDNVYQDYMPANSTTELRFTGIAQIPLACIHDFFNNCPSISSLFKFDAKFFANFITNDSWNIVYNLNNSNVPGSSFTINTISSFNNSSDSSCPFIIASAGVSSEDPTLSGDVVTTPGKTFFGLTMNQTTSGTPITLTLKSSIGWNNTTSLPCRIYIPRITFTPERVTEIQSKRQYSVIYNDYDMDRSLLKRAGGSRVESEINVKVGRPRKLHIIPFLSDGMTIGGKTFLGPCRSPFSSAPTTCSPCKMRNIRVSVGGNALFENPLEYNFNMYTANVFQMLGDMNGNSIKSDLFTGLITKSMWEKCYGVVTLNVENSAGDRIDQMTKSFKISFDIDGSSSYSWDFIIVVEYQQELVIDRVFGTATQEP